MRRRWGKEDFSLFVRGFAGSFDMYLLILHTWYSHVPGITLPACTTKIHGCWLCLAWLELEWTFGLFCVLDLICIFIGSCLNAFMKIRLPGLVLLCPSCIIYCLSRVGKRLFVFTCSHFKFVVQSFIFYRKESDSRWSRYFVAASLFIPSCWTSQVICWRFQWRCFCWADSDFTDLTKA